jgi:hypothetical protein
LGAALALALLFAGTALAASPARLLRAACPATVGQAHCRTAPETKILSGPAAAIPLGAGVVFSFDSNRRRSRFQCRLDGGRWKSCHSPLRLAGVGLGNHAFRVRARAAGRPTDPSPATRAFEVVAATRQNGDGSAPPSPPSSPPGEEPDSRLFAADGVWNEPLGAATPVDPGSTAMVSRLLHEIEGERAAGGGPSLNVWSRASLYEVAPEQPRVPVYLDTGPWGEGLGIKLRTGVPVPAGARPASGQDRSMAIWQPQTDSYWEFFHMDQNLHAPQFSRLPLLESGCPSLGGTFSFALTALNPRGETTATAPPQQVRVPLGGGCIRVFWSPIAGASGYRLYKASGASPLQLLATVGAAATSFRDDGTLPGQGPPPPAANGAATPGEWHASYGGFLADASQSPGYYRDVFGAAGSLVQQWNWGAAATGLPLAGGMVTREDVQRGEIDHALSLGLANLPSNSVLRAGAFAFPAQRSDGRSTAPDSIPEGARLFLDPNLDLGRLQLSPLARMLAEAAQRYGMIVHDGSEGTTIYAEDPSPYVALGEGNFYRPLTGSDSIRAMQGFPWSSLRVERMHLCTRGPCTAS